MAAWVLALGAAAVCCSLQVAAAVAPRAGGAITGVVRSGTSGRAVAGASVSLLFISPQGPEARGQARSDASGRFAFGALQDGRYLVQAIHQGVSYAAHAVISGGSPVAVALQVYDASDRVPLQIGLLGLAVDVQLGYVRASEVVHLKNSTSRTFVGTVRFALPKGARFVTFHEGLHQPRVEGDAIVDRLIIRPGAHQVAYAYTVKGSDEVSLDRRVELPIERIESFTIAPAEARSPRLQPALSVTHEDGRTYTRASGRAVPPGHLAISVIGVPSPQFWAAPAAAGALAVFLVIGLIWAVVRSERIEEGAPD